MRDLLPNPHPEQEDIEQEDIEQGVEIAAGS